MKNLILLIFILAGCNSYESKRYQDTISKLEEELLLCKSGREIDTVHKKSITVNNEAVEEFRDSLGIWEASYFVDDFGDETDQGVVHNSNLINGFFSNTATQDSPLNVNILVVKPDKISIMLYEYARNNPMKTSSSRPFKVNVKDADGNKLRLTANSGSDRLTLGPSHSRKLYDSMIKGGTMEFVIIDRERPTSKYTFTIDETSGIEKAFLLLK